jgi:hypothetical protein
MKSTGAAGAEDAILGILSTFPELIPEAIAKLSLCAEDFVTDFNKRVFVKMAELGSAFDLGLLGDDFSQDEISRIVRDSVSRQSLTNNGIEEVDQCLRRLRGLKNKEKLSLEDLIASKRKKQ